MKGVYSFYPLVSFSCERRVLKFLLALLLAILLLLALYLQLILSLKGENMLKVPEEVLRDVRYALHKYLKKQKGNTVVVTAKKLLKACPRLKKYSPQAVGMALFLLINSCGKIKIRQEAWEALKKYKNSKFQNRWILVRTPNPYRRVEVPNVA